MRKLLRTGLVPAGAWGGQAVGIAPTERQTLRRQMAQPQQQARRNRLSFISEVNNLEFEEEVSTMATLAGAEGVWVGRWREELLKAYKTCRRSHVRNP